MTGTTQKRLVVVSGGLSEESTTHRLGAGIAEAVVRLGHEADLDVEVSTIKVRDLSQEIASASLTGFAPERLAEAYRTLGDADGVVAVSPTYKASYTGLFKGFWDVTSTGILAGVPVILGATGGSPRHSLVTDYAMRPLFAYLKALTMPTSIFAAAEDWGHSGLEARMSEAAAQLIGQWSVKQRDGVAPSKLDETRDQAKDPFKNAPTMAQLLGRD